MKNLLNIHVVWISQADAAAVGVSPRGWATMRRSVYWAGPEVPDHAWLPEADRKCASARRRWMRVLRAAQARACAEPPPPECSICRRRHGREVEHASE